MPSCPNGHPLSAGTMFCQQCGASLAASIEETTAIPIQRRAPSVDPEHDQSSAAPSPRRNSNSVIYVISGLVILLAIAGAVATMLLTSDSDSPDTTTAPPPALPTVSVTDPGDAATPEPDSTEPTVNVNGCNAPHQLARPTDIVLACGNKGMVSQITWSTWTPLRADGMGTYYAGPDGVYRVGISLMSPSSTSLGATFTEVELVPLDRTGPNVTWTYDSVAQSWKSDQPTSVSLPPQGKLCSDRQTDGDFEFGRLPKYDQVSCEFIRNVHDAYVRAGGTGQTLTVSARSPQTKKRYDNLVCRSDDSGAWVICRGGAKNTAHMFFSLR